MTVLFEAIAIIVWVLLGFAIGRQISVKDKAARAGVRELAKMLKHSRVSFWDHDGSVTIHESTSEMELRHKKLRDEAREKLNKTTSSHTGPGSIEFSIEVDEADGVDKNIMSMFNSRIKPVTTGFTLPKDFGKMIKAIEPGEKIMDIINRDAGEIMHPTGPSTDEKVDLILKHFGLEPHCDHTHKLKKVTKSKK